LESHLGILRGARTLSQAVATTLGPGGRNVAIDPWTPELENDLLNYPKPIITKDGVTVAQNINLSQNQMHNIGAKLLIDAAQKSAEESGDGTTTCTVLATAMLQEGLKIPHKNIFIRKGMQSAVRQICENLASQAIRISTSDEVRNIALVSSNQDEHIANILTDIYEKVGLTGAISITDGDGISLAPEVQFVEGVSFDSGFLSPYFSDDRSTINYDHAYVALVDSEIQTEKELVNLLEFCKMTRKPLIIVAQDFSSEALTSMVVNKLQLGLQLVAIKAPMFQGSDLI